MYIAHIHKKRHFHARSVCIMSSLRMRLSGIGFGTNRRVRCFEVVIVKLSEKQFFALGSISTLPKKYCLESISFHCLFTIVRFVYLFMIVRFNSVLQRRYVFPWPELVILACDILTSNSRHPRSNPVMSASSQAAKNSITNLHARGTAAVILM